MNLCPRDSARAWCGIAQIVGCLACTQAIDRIGFAEASQPDPNAPIWDVKLSQGIVDALCDRLLLDATQEQFADARFLVYQEELQSLSGETYDKMLAAGLSRSFELDKEGLEYGNLKHIEERSALRYQWKNQYLVGVARADELLARFLDELYSVLDESQADQFHSVPGLIRRLNLMKVQPNAAVIDFKAPIDIIRLVEQAMAAGNELEWLRNPPTDKQASVAENAAHAKLDSILRDYESLLDPILIKRVQRNRRPVARDESVVLLPDTATGRRRVDELEDEWTLLFQLNQDTMQRIATVLEEHRDLTCRTAWEDRFYKALCPDLMSERIADWLLTWLTARADHSAEQLASARQLYETHVALRRELRIAAVGAGAIAMAKAGWISGSEPSQVAYARRLLQLERHHNAFIPLFEANLSQPQLDALHSRLESIKLLQPSLLLEPVHHPLRSNGGPPGVLLPPVDEETGYPTPYDEDERNSHE